MKRIGVFYASREGHTLKVATHVAARLKKHGFEVEIMDVKEREACIALNNCDAIIIAASVHMGRHEREMIDFVRRFRQELESVPNAFLSVSLSQAGVERGDLSDKDREQFSSDVRAMIDRFIEATRWHPNKIKAVAGALAYKKYNFLVRHLLQRIARKVGADTDTSRNYNYTHWIALDIFTDEFSASLERPPVRTNLAA